LYLDTGIPVDFAVVYEHMWKTYTGRMREAMSKPEHISSSLRRITDASGQLLYDESAGVDAFGHKNWPGPEDMSDNNWKND